MVWFLWGDWECYGGGGWGCGWWCVVVVGIVSVLGGYGFLCMLYVLDMGCGVNVSGYMLGLWLLICD